MKKLCSLILTSGKPRYGCVAFNLTSISDNIFLSSFSGTKIKCPYLLVSNKEGPIKRKPHSAEIPSTYYQQNLLKLNIVFLFLYLVDNMESKKECVKVHFAFSSPNWNFNFWCRLNSAVINSECKKRVNKIFPRENKQKQTNRKHNYHPRF